MTKYSPGDRVIRTVDAGINMVLGDKGTVIEYMSGPGARYVRVKSDRGIVQNWKESSMTLIEKAHSFEVGDKVTYVPLQGSQFNIPGVGVVIEVKESLLVRFDGWKGGHGMDKNNWYVDPADLRYFDEAPMDEAAFVVGDVVQHIDGTKGVVIDPPTGKTVRAILENGSIVLFHAGSLKHAVSWGTPKSNAPFEFGDRVVRVGSNNGCGGARIGQVATVIETRGNRVVYPGCKHYDTAAGKFGEAWVGIYTAHVTKNTDELVEVIAEQPRLEAVCISGKRPVGIIFDDCITEPTVKLTTKETPMLNIEDRIYVNGTNAKELTDNQLIAQISVTEKEIARLGELKTKSEKVKERIASLKAGAARLAEILDAR